jgi:hypothetical protein
MWNFLTVPTVWYFNCPLRCGMFLLFLECGILTFHDNVQCPGQCKMLLLFLQCGILIVHDNVECSYCSYSVVF